MEDRLGPSARGFHLLSGVAATAQLSARQRRPHGRARRHRRRDGRLRCVLSEARSTCSCSSSSSRPGWPVPRLCSSTGLRFRYWRVSRPWGEAGEGWPSGRTLVVSLLGPPGPFWNGFGPQRRAWAKGADRAPGAAYTGPMKVTRAQDLEGLRAAGRAVAQTLAAMGAALTPGCYRGARRPWGEDAGGAGPPAPHAIIVSRRHPHQPERERHGVPPRTWRRGIL